MPRPSRKTEYPPLLGEGLHQVTVEQVRALCVDHAMFKQAKGRADLFDRLVRALEQIAKAGIPFDAWLDGSFLTQKLNPGDVDVVLRIQFDDWNRATKEQQAVIEWIGGVDCKKEYKLKGYYFFDCDASHSRALEGELNRKQWLGDFGYAQMSKERKGIAVLTF